MNALEVEPIREDSEIFIQGSLASGFRALWSRTGNMSHSVIEGTTHPSDTTPAVTGGSDSQGMDPENQARETQINQDMNNLHQQLINIRGAFDRESEEKVRLEMEAVENRRRMAQMQEVMNKQREDLAERINSLEEEGIRLSSSRVDSNKSTWKPGDIAKLTDTDLVGCGAMAKNRFLFVRGAGMQRFR